MVTRELTDAWGHARGEVQTPEIDVPSKLGIASHGLFETLNFLQGWRGVHCHPETLAMIN
jgi:hypothetical protein